MDNIDKEIIRILQDNFPLTKRPFLEVAKRLNISEEEVINRIRKMIEKGIIRKLSASVRHRKLGYIYNALVVWKIPEENVDEICEKFSNIENVSHCYEREIVKGKWEYNIYTVVHGKTKEDVEKTIEYMKKISGINDPLILYSIKEYKKTYKKYDKD